ncbi:recombinase family protein [Acetivibrio clariflavus]|uniref:recombinase family protein n=1 Tax=Acetivibrio clariflavus TaxID=288965 RepID=UPI000482121C|nr:recombinase family protein [Acetivibrio clariflavus]
MNIVAIYCRLSDEDKNKANKYEDSESIQNQKKLLLDFARENKWEVYKIYCDDDYSGLDSERPGFKQLIADAEAGKFNIVLCKSQSRFTRDMELVEKYLHHKFIEWGIRFIGVTDNADTFEKGNKKSRQINGLVNEWYCEDISENIKAVFDVKRKRGEFIGSFAPYGYKKDPLNKNKLLIDEEAARVVRRIFSRYLEGFGAQQIASMLNHEGIPNPTKYKELMGLNYKNPFKTEDYGLWNKTTVKRILRNETYIGNTVQAKRKKLSYKSKKMIAVSPDKWVRVENTHQPIIDKSVFFAVQQRMDGRIKSAGNGKPHLFASKVKCHDCGSTMVKVTSGKYSYLRCKLYSAPYGNKMCTSHLTRLDELTDLIECKIKEHLKRYIDIPKMAERLKNELKWDRDERKYHEELKKIRKEISEKELAIKSLYIDKIKGIIDEEQFIELNREFIKEKRKLSERQKTIQKEMELNEKNGIDYGDIVKDLIEFKELKHNMVSIMIGRIEIGEKTAEGKRIKIYWLF